LRRHVDRHEHGAKPEEYFEEFVSEAKITLQHRECQDTGEEDFRYMRGIKLNSAATQLVNFDSIRARLWAPLTEKSYRWHK